MVNQGSTRAEGLCRRRFANGDLLSHCESRFTPKGRIARSPAPVDSAEHGHWRSVLEGFQDERDPRGYGQPDDELWNLFGEIDPTFTARACDFENPGMESDVAAYGLKDAVLVVDGGGQMAGSDLRDVANNAVTASRLVEQVTRQVGNRDVVEQAAIAGLLKNTTLDNEEAASYLATRLENVAGELEKGWQGGIEDTVNGKAIVIQRRLRGITEKYVIDRRIVGLPEAV